MKQEKMGNNSSNGEYIFKTTDPLGREVRLKSTTWDYHVISQRDALFGQEDTVKSVIENPYYILSNNVEDPTDSRQKYLDIVVLDSFKSLKNLIIVVDHNNESYGDVVTIIPKSGLNQEKTKGGPFYVRGGYTNK